MSHQSNGWKVMILKEIALFYKVFNLKVEGIIFMKLLK